MAEFEYKVASGKHEDVTAVHKVGRTTVGANYAPITVSSIYRTPQGADAKRLRIRAGGHVDDDAAGSHAWVVVVQGLDDSFNLTGEAIVTAGASASALTQQSFTRAFHAYVMSSGTYADLATGSHAGDIVIEDEDGNEWLRISSDGIARGASEVACYSVPVGFEALIKNIHISVESGGSVDLLGVSRAGIDKDDGPYDAVRVFAPMKDVSGYENIVLEVPVRFKGPCDLAFLAKSDTGAADITVEFEVWQTPSYV